MKKLPQEERAVGKTFSVFPEHVEKVRILAEVLNVSQGAVIQRAIEAMYSANIRKIVDAGLAAKTVDFPY